LAYSGSQTPAGTSFQNVAAGDFHALALRSDGTVAGWGDAGYTFWGQSSVPPGTYRTIAAGGNLSVGLRPDGTIIDWGRDAGSAPTGSGYVDIAAGGSWANSDAAAAIDAAGYVRVWGSGSVGIPDSSQPNFTSIAVNPAGVVGVRLGDCLSDLDASGSTDFGDIAQLMLDFGPCPSCVSDLDATGIVDLGDVAVLLLSFGPCL